MNEEVNSKKLSTSTADYDESTHSASPSSQKAIVALLGLKPICHRAIDSLGGWVGIEQPVYYVSHALKDTKTPLSLGRKNVLSDCLLITEATSLLLGLRSASYDKVHVIKALLRLPILSDRMS